MCLPLCLLLFVTYLSFIITPTIACYVIYITAMCGLLIYILIPYIQLEQTCFGVESFVENCE